MAAEAWGTWAGPTRSRPGWPPTGPPRRRAAAGEKAIDRGGAWPAALGQDRPLPRVAGPLRDRDRRSPRRRRGRRVGAAAGPGHCRRGDARTHPHRPRAARARRRRHAAAAPGSGVGLAYWASSYQELPGPPLLIGHQDVAGRWPTCRTSPRTRRRIPHQCPGGGTWPTSPTNSSRRWRRWAGRAMPSPSSMQLAGGAGLPAQRRRRAMPSPCSTRSPRPGLELVLPWLAEEDHDAALGYAWQAVASIHVAYAIDRHPPGAPGSTPPRPTNWSRCGRGLGRRARHQADRGGAASHSPAPASRPCCGRRRRLPSAWLRSGPDQFGRPVATIGPWNTAPLVAPVSKSARSAWGP
jgi:hypothetical protein